VARQAEDEPGFRFANAAMPFFHWTSAFVVKQW